MRRLAPVFVLLLLLLVPLGGARSAAAIVVVRVSPPTMSLPLGHQLALDPTRTHMYAVAPFNAPVLGKSPLWRMHALNPSTGKVTDSLKLPSVIPESVGFDKKRGVVLVAASQSAAVAEPPARGGSVAYLYLLAPNPLRVRSRVVLGSAEDDTSMLVADMVVSSADGRAFLLMGDGSILSVGLNGGSIRHLQAIPGATPSILGSIQIVRSVRRLIATSASGVGIYDLDTGALLRSLRLSTVQVAVDAARTLLIVPAGPQMLIVDLRAGSIVRQINATSLSLFLGGFASVDTRRGSIYVFASHTASPGATGSQEIAVFDEASGDAIAHIPLVGEGQALAVDPSSGHLFAALSPPDILAMIDTHTNTLAGTLTLHSPAGRGNPIQLALTPATHRLYVIGWDKQWVIDSR